MESNSGWSQLLELLNEIGGRHAVGRIDLVENRLVGMKSHGVYETPGGTLLYLAHRELETLVLDKETMRAKDRIALDYADLVYNGRWYTPVREAYDAFVATTQQRMTGEVRFQLYKGNATVVGRRSPFSLYREDLATFGPDMVYNQGDAEAFIKLYGLSMKVQALTK
jgi:argininosuccinate synthase